MKHLRSEIEIEATSEQVWKVLTDLKKFPEWNPFITRVRGDLRQDGQLDV